MRILYFAWVRERAGTAEEEIELPETVETVGDLIGWLRTRGPEFEYAFSDLRAIRSAVDQTHVPLDASVRGAREIAFFPPVTGG